MAHVQIELTIGIDPDEPDELVRAAVELRAALTPTEWLALERLAMAVMAESSLDRATARALLLRYQED